MQQANVKNYSVSFLQEQEFLDLKREIFGQQIYYFETEEEAPIIIDAGAHIGLATLYFKWLYPGAKIFAFEPNPELASFFRLNVANNNLADVILEQAALGNSEEKRAFFVDETPWRWYSVGSFFEGAWNGEQKKQGQIQVAVKRLPTLVASLTRVDLLKLDIEGAEWGVLRSLKGELAKVRHLIFEFHPRCQGVKLTEVLAYLQRQGFFLQIKDRRGKILKSHHDQELVLVEGSRQ